MKNFLQLQQKAKENNTLIQKQSGHLLTIICFAAKFELDLWRTEKLKSWTCYL